MKLVQTIKRCLPECRSIIIMEMNHLISH